MCICLWCPILTIHACSGPIWVHKASNSSSRAE
jgi:hypothetical protein